jgi:hypothetical protein
MPTSPDTQALVAAINNLASEVRAVRAAIIRQSTVMPSGHPGVYTPAEVAQVMAGVDKIVGKAA